MVDNTIALQVRPFQMPDIGQIYGQAQNIQMNRMRMAEAQETGQERNALRTLAASGVDPYSPEGLAQLRRVAPTLAPQYAQAASQQAYQRAQIDRIRSQNDREAFQTAQTLLVGVRNADDYARLRPTLVERFPQYAEFFRPEYSPELIQRLAIGAEGLIRRETEAAAANRPNEYERAVRATGARPGTPEYENAMRRRVDYLTGARPSTPAEFERKRDEMIARGVPADIASGLATGQFRFSTATDGTMNVVDVGRGRVVFGPGAGGTIGQQTPATPPQGAATPPQGAVTPPQGAATPPQGAVTPTARPLPPAGAGTLPTTGTDFRGATGAPGFVAETANTIVDLFGGRALPAPEAARATQALQNLDTRTRMFLQSAIPGRPSNYLMEMIGGMTVSPATISLGPERSRERVQQTTRFLETTMADLEDISRSRGTGRFTQQQIADANLSLNQLRSLLADYRQLEQAFESGRTSTPTPRRRGTLDRGVQTGVQPPTAPGEFRTQSGFTIRPIE